MTKMHHAGRGAGRQPDRRLRRKPGGRCQPVPAGPAVDLRDGPEAAGDGGGADVAARSLGLERQWLCLGKGAICPGGRPRQPVDARMVVTHAVRLDLAAAALDVVVC